MTALLGGCAKTSAWLSGRDKPEPQAVVLGAPNAELYLDELYKLAEGDPAQQAEIYLDAESAAKLTPGPSTNLRLALILATPGHAESDPERAQSLLREILSQTTLLSPAEIALATIHLKSVEARIVLIGEARSLRATTSQATATEEAAINQRLAAVEAENRKLRSDLAAAEDKLKAISTIERSIRQQGE